MRRRIWEMENKVEVMKAKLEGKDENDKDWKMKKKKTGYILESRWRNERKWED